MNIKKILNSLENSWEREAILLKIKNGSEIDEIVNKFLKDNETQIKQLNTLLRPEDKDLLKQIGKLSACEAKLINKINNFNYLKNDNTQNKINRGTFTLSNSFPTNKISLFMINWSNQFVVIALLTISAIALSKQAWA